jgi:hypothetical protein
MTRSGHVCGSVLVGSYVVGAYLAGIRPRVPSEGLGTRHAPLIGVRLSYMYLL